MIRRRGIKAAIAKTGSERNVVTVTEFGETELREPSLDGEEPGGS